jgi:hypothetical protein
MRYRYSHVVKRASGFKAGWFKGPDAASEAEQFAAECNATVPGDPAAVETLDWSSWETFLNGAAA